MLIRCLSGSSRAPTVMCWVLVALGVDMASATCAPQTTIRALKLMFCIYRISIDAHRVAAIQTCD